MKTLFLCSARSAAIALGLIAPMLVQADSGREMPRNVPAAYVQECAACHTAYPPGLLPAASWGRVMGRLDTHYGTNASLDTDTVRQLSGWLQAYGGTYKRVKEEPPEDRITRSAWFERKHRQIDASVWRLPSVKTPAQCAACHTGADKGRFSDDELRMPAGLPLSARKAWRD